MHADFFRYTRINHWLDNRSSVHATKLSSSAGSGDPSNNKRGKKPIDKNAQPQQLIRQKSAFKVTDSPTASLLSQQSVTSPDDASNEIKPLKVVIKRERVEGGGSVLNDDLQQQAMKQRKKQQQTQQQQMGNTAAGNISAAMRKMSNNNLSAGPSSSVLVKSESLDMSQFNSESNSMTGITDGMQQNARFAICQKDHFFLQMIFLSGNDHGHPHLYPILYHHSHRPRHQQHLNHALLHHNLQLY